MRRFLELLSKGALRLKLGEANARIAELETQVESLKLRLDDATKVNLTLARRETKRRVQNRELAMNKWPIYLYGTFTDCQTGEIGWAVTEMEVTKNGVVHRVVHTCDTEKAARQFARDAEAERDESDG